MEWMTKEGEMRAAAARYTISVAIAAWSSVGAAAQNVIGEREATAHIEEFGWQRCVTIPVGVHRTRPPST
jgi:hypothetical protein